MLRPNVSSCISSPFSFMNELYTLGAINEYRTPLHQLNRLRWLLQRSWYLIISLALSSSMLLTAHASDSPSANQEVSSLLELLDEETVDKFDLGELVSPPSNALSNTSKIFVVTAKDILNLNARNVGEALRFVPVLIFSEGGTKNPKLASLRGLGSRQYVVFIDGRPVYDTYFGDVDLNNLPIDNVALIKVVKGPVEAAYGPNAFGGVIKGMVKKSSPARPQPFPAFVAHFGGVGLARGT